MHRNPTPLAPMCARRISPHHPFAEVTGLSVARLRRLPPAELAEASSFLRNAVSTHGALILRGQHGLTPEDELAFNKAFGYHDPAVPPPKFGWVAGIPAHDATLRGSGWPAVQCQGNVRLGPGPVVSHSRAARCRTCRRARGGHGGVTGPSQLKQTTQFTVDGFHSDEKRRKKRRRPRPAARPAGAYLDVLHARHHGRGRDSAGMHPHGRHRAAQARPVAAGGCTT